TLFYGIDISKDVFDVMDEKGIHYQFKNNYSGFKKYLKLLDNHNHRFFQPEFPDKLTCRFLN
ncbi:MAG: hypothetical protein V3U92_03935, partial [Cellulophaga sp.]